MEKKEWTTHSRLLSLPAWGRCANSGAGDVGRRTRGREQWTLDERIVGGDDFTAQVLDDIAKMSKATGLAEFQDAIARTSAARHVAVKAALGSSKRPHLVRIRRELCARAVLDLGLPVSQVAATLRISARTVLRAVDRKRLGACIPHR